MTPELQKYYEERFSTMATQGWKDLMEDIDNMINSLNNISTIQKRRTFYPSLAENLKTGQHTSIRGIE